MANDDGSRHRVREHEARSVCVDREVRCSRDSQRPIAHVAARRKANLSLPRPDRAVDDSLEVSAEGSSRCAGKKRCGRDRNPEGAR